MRATKLLIPEREVQTAASQVCWGNATTCWLDALYCRCYLLRWITPENMSSRCETAVSPHYFIQADCVFG